MKKNVVFLLVVSFLLTQCGKENDPFAISKGALGNLNKEVMIKQIDSLFAQDSIVKLSPIENALGTQGEVEIYEKGGNKLLLISPHNERDPESAISNIQIFDERFTTDNGLHINSNFGNLKANYEIANIQTTINAVVVFLKDSDIYVTIDKKHLPSEIRYNLDAKVEATQIPDDTPFKYFMIGWDQEEENSSED